MTLHVLGDKDTVLGLSLVGVSGTVVKSAAAMNQVLDEQLDRSDLRRLWITRETADQVRGRIDSLKTSTLEPLIVELPTGQGEGGQSLQELVQVAVGIELKQSEGE